MQGGNMHKQTLLFAVAGISLALGGCAGGHNNWGNNAGTSWNASPDHNSYEWKNSPEGKTYEQLEHNQKMREWLIWQQKANGAQ